MKPTEDSVDAMLTAWRHELPTLDPSALDQVGRIFVLVQRLEQRVTVALADHGLTLGQFDILATLRRHGPTGGLTPKQLMTSVMLTSGGMTSRLDGLEQLGYIVRQSDPADRRGVVIGLTTVGRKKIEAAAACRFQEAQEAIHGLTEKDRRSLTVLLRKWLLQLDQASD